MHRALEAMITPFYAQVLLITSPDMPHPQWETGAERAVATAHAIAVSTTPDIDGAGQNVQVSVEVWIDSSPDDDWTEVLRTPLLVSSWGIAIRDVVTNDEHRAALPRGEYAAVVLVHPETSPRHVRLVLSRT